MDKVVEIFEGKFDEKYKNKEEREDNYSGLINNRYGRLVVKSVFKKDAYVKCKCLCDCGNTTDVYYSNLISGRTVSCGCRGAEIANRYKNIVGNI